MPFEVGKLVEVLTKGWMVAVAFTGGLGLLLYAPDSWTWVRFGREFRSDYGKMVAPAFYIFALYSVLLTLNHVREAVLGWSRKDAKERRQDRKLDNLNEQERLVMKVAMASDGGVTLPDDNAAVRSLLAAGILQSTGVHKSVGRVLMRVSHPAEERLRKYPHLLDVDDTPENCGYLERLASGD